MSYKKCYDKHDRDHYCCDCCCCYCHHDHHHCTDEEIYLALGKALYEALDKYVELPPGHPSLRKSLCMLINGKELPPGHPTAKQVMLTLANSL